MSDEDARSACVQMIEASSAPVLELTSTIGCHVRSRGNPPVNKLTLKLAKLRTEHPIAPFVPDVVL